MVVEEAEVQDPTIVVDLVQASGATKVQKAEKAALERRTRDH